MARNSVRRKLAAAALFTAALSGCKNGFEIPIWNPFAKPDKAALQTDSDGGQWQNEEIQPRESALSKSFKKLSDTVSKPFKKGDAEASPPEDEAISVTAKSGPPDPSLYVSLARMEAKAGNVKTAAEQYEKALDIDPKHGGALLGLARLYDREGDSAKAFEYYRRAVKADPDGGTALNDLGLCYARNGLLDESIAMLKRAVAAEPEHKLYRNNLATVLVEAGRAPEALRTLEPIHGEAVAHYNVGFLLNHCKRKSEALEHFEAAVELDPSLKQAQEWVAILSNQVPAESAPATVAEETRLPATNTSNVRTQAPQRQAPREPSPIGGATEPADIVELDAVPLDSPITTPYVPQSDLHPNTRPISQSTVVEQPAPRPEPKLNTRTAPMNPHVPPRVEMPARPAVDAAPTLPADEGSGEELIGPKLMQKRPATGDRYEVVGPVAPRQPVRPPPAAAQSPIQSAGVAGLPTAGNRQSGGTPPLPEHVSTLPDDTLPETAPTTTPAPKARTAAGGARFPAGRY